jgi:phosphoesterase RecJ-like protein
MTTTPALHKPADIVRAIAERRSFVLTSHARPDGDAIGSQLAMAFALRQLGKQARCVNRDVAPPPLQSFPGVSEIEIAAMFDGNAEAVIVMECGDLARTGVKGFDRSFIINIDHHPGNTLFGAINWFDESACACGEMVFECIELLGVPFTKEMATHIYLAILTDTGGFHYANISARTFEICRRCVEAGVDPAEIAHTVYDSSTMARLRLMGGVLHDLELALDGRVAIANLSLELHRQTCSTPEDAEGLINLPLTVKEIQAIAFCKEAEPGCYRVSMRSKGNVDVNAIAKHFGGGGHKNAAGCTITGNYADVRARLLPELERALG